MKPTSYKNLPAYGQAQAQAQAVQSNTAAAVKTIAPAMVEAQYYRQGLERSLQLGYLGLQKEMFEKTHEEKGRQFDVEMGEKKREFGINMGLVRDQMKYQRRQDNRAELLGMVNVGINIGFGFQQYRQNAINLKLMQQNVALNRHRVALMQQAQNKGKK